MCGDVNVVATGSDGRQGKEHESTTRGATLTGKLGSGYHDAATVARTCVSVGAR